MGIDLKSKSIVCTIGARGGSKGVPGKNVRLLNGKPLIAHTIEQAKKCKIFQHIAVSSDSQEILKIAKEFGADILVERPAELATDKAAKMPVIKHCFLEAEKRTGKKFDIDVDLDVTSPLRTTEDIIGSIELLLKKNVKNVITGAISRRSPYFNLVEETAQGLVVLSKRPDVPFVCRQDVPKSYDMNSSIYVWTREALLNCERVVEDQTALYVMPEDRSIDIDSPMDWKLVEMLMKERE